MIYNEEIETLIDAIFENAQLFDNINPQLEALYEETKYPGVLAWMAYNYEESLYGPYDQDLAYEYNLKAAQENYYGSKIWLSRYHNEQAIKENSFSQYWLEDALNELYHSEDYYLQAKNYIALGLFDENKKDYRKGINMMKELAGDGYEPAMRFIDLLETDEEIQEETEEEIDFINDFEFIDEDFIEEE